MIKNTITILGTLIVAGLFVGLVMLERGYFAIGGELLVIILILFAGISKIVVDKRLKV